jgi:diacylglycerol kinase (ATP)
VPRGNLPASSGGSTGEVGRRPFSLAARARGFGYAWRGLVYLATTQHNAWIHLAVAALVIAAAVHFRIDRWELAWLILAIGLVLAAEAMNTAVEVLADTLAPDFNPGIGRAWQPVGLWAPIAKIGPGEPIFCRICRRIAVLWGKKPVKKGPSRSLIANACSR